MSDMSRTQTPAAFVGALCATIGLAVVYEALFALQVIHYPDGATSGTHPQYETHILEIALIAMTLASVVFLIAVFWPRLRNPLISVKALWAIPAVTAALVVARLFTFDSYSAPHLVRASTENGDFLYWWIPIGVMATAVIALLGRKHPRLAMLVIATVLFVGAGTALIIAAFH
jgi:tellurite resistance protein TehA-like permease